MKITPLNFGVKQCIGNVLIAFALMMGCSAEAQQLVHRYSFTSDASDSVGGADGVLVKGASITNGAVLLNGVDGYVDLPNDLVVSLTNITIEAWVVWNGGGAWQRLYDFGSSVQGEDQGGFANQSMFLTPSNGGVMRASIFSNGPGAQDVVDVAPLSSGSVKHVVWTFDSVLQTANIYVDGALVGSNTNATIRPADLGPTFNNWLGRSQFNDATFNGSITEFRIYDGALSNARVADNFAAGPGPNQPAVLKNRYSFTSDASDSVGGAHGTLVNGALITNGAVLLNGVDGYVDLPNGLVVSLTNITIEAWVVWNGGGAWQRLYDFGSSVQGEDQGGFANQSMFLTPSNGGVMRASIFSNGPGAQDVVDVAPLSSGSLKHVVWTFDASIRTARIYIDGVLVGSNTGATIRPADLGPTVNDWLGRSQFNDTYFNGAIAEFRIYDGALSASEVAASFAAGPAQTGRGELQSISLRVKGTMRPGDSQQAAVLATFANVSDVDITTDPAAVYQSSDTSVLTVDTNGLIQAVASGDGSATITVSYQSKQDVESVAVVVVPPAVFTHRYSFTSDATDSVGGASGELVGGASISGNAVHLDGTDGYVNLPNDLVLTLTNASIEAWVVWKGGPFFQRLYDFGNSIQGEDLSGFGSQSMFLTPNAGAASRASIFTNGPGVQDVEDGPAFDTDVLTHVVWTYDAVRETATLHVNGVAVSTNRNATMGPSDLGTTFNNWLGRSQFNDAYFNGSITEFRIYDGIVSDAQVADNEIAGPDPGTDRGSVQAVRLQVQTIMQPGDVQQAKVIADFLNLSAVNITRDSNTVYRSSNTNLLTVSTNGVIKAVASENGSATITAGYLGKEDTKTVTLVVPEPAVLKHRYSFTSDASDSVGSAHGTLVNGALISAGAVQLDGVDDYVNLPNDLVLSLTNATIEAWVVWNGGGAWQRIYDFGNSVQGEDQSGFGNQSMFVTPSNGGVMRASVFNNGPGAQDVVDVAPLSIGSVKHVVWTFDATIRTARLYIDGVLVGSNTSATVRPVDLGPTFNDWLGRSQFNDPYFKGSITEFRIYDGALSASQVAASFGTGPDSLSVEKPVLSVARSGNDLVLSWSATFTGYVLESTGNLGPQAQWNAVGGGPVVENGLNKFTVPITSGSGFYRLRK